MEGKEILELLSASNEQKKILDLRKKERIDSKEKLKEIFLICKDSCSCKTKKCKASGFKQCPKCKDVLKSKCTKRNCRDGCGKGPQMVLPRFDKKTARRQLFTDNAESYDERSETDEIIKINEELDNDSEDEIIEELEDERGEFNGDIYNNESDDERSDIDGEVDFISEPTVFKKGNCVKITTGAFEGFYAKIIERNHDEYEINYFERRYGKYVLKNFDLDSRTPDEMMQVIFEIDNRSRYTFHN